MPNQDLMNLASLDEETRLAAAQRLAHSVQPEAVNALIALLDNLKESHKVRRAAAISLGIIGDGRAVGSLIQAAATDHYEVLPAVAATALGRLGDPQAIACLSALLNRWQDNVKTAAAHALVALGATDVLLTAVKDGDEEMRWIAAEALAASSHRLALVAAVSGNASASAEWKAAVRVLADRQDAEALDTLLGSLKSPQWDVRIRSAQALARLADPRSAEALRDALGDSESSVQLAARAGLTRIGRPPSDDELAAGALNAYAAQGLTIQSVAAQRLACPNCRNIQAPPAWPVRGDRIPFYSQADPAEFSIRVTCAKCGGTWHTVWDSDPGRFYPLQI